MVHEDPQKKINNISDKFVRLKRFTIFALSKHAMILSKACEYGVKAIIFIAKQSMEGKRNNLIEISDAINSPQAFTAKILQQLVKGKIISSIRGTKGGFEISESNLQTLTLLEIVKCIDGEELLSACVLGLKTCSSKNPCPIHAKYTLIREDLRRILETTLVKELALTVYNQKVVLKN